LHHAKFSEFLDDIRGNRESYLPNYLNIVIFLSAREFYHIRNMHSLLPYTCHPLYISDIRINNNIRWLTTKTRKEIDTIYVTEDIELDEYPREKIARNKSMAATVAGALSGIEEGQGGELRARRRRKSDKRAYVGAERHGDR